jgi:hypothetical protein
MDLKGIMSISGKPGLYKHVSQTKNGIIVESLVDKKRMQAFASAKISALQDIAVYTDGEDKPLVEVFRNIFRKENGGKSIDSNSKPEEIKKYFGDILPNYDQERVYVSDMKRAISWYNLLRENNLVDLEKSEDELKEEKKSENTETQSE